MFLLGYRCIKEWGNSNKYWWYGRCTRSWWG